MQLISVSTMETVEKLSAKEAKDLESQVSVPYRVEDVTVLSPGEWNGLQWTASELKEAVENTDFSLSQERGDEAPPNSSLYYDHEDRSAENWIGNVENVRVDGNGDVKTDLVITDKQLAMNLEYGAPFGVSPKADGLIDEQRKMQDFQFENFSMVVNPAVKTTWLNEDIETVLQNMEIHRPRFNGRTKESWEYPNLNDFTDEAWDELTRNEKRAIGRHFLISKTGFPADNYTDLALPVVDSDGNLNLNALQNAKARVSQVSGIEEDEVARTGRIINNLASGNFPESNFTKVEMQDYSIHRPEWSSKADKEWNEPTLNEFTSENWDDLTDDEKTNIGQHFIVSSTGFPAENYGDMGLPVVEADGTLNLNALANAKARAGQVEGLGDDEVERVQSMITNIANEEFPEASFDEVDMAKHKQEMADFKFGEDDKVKWESSGGTAMGVVRDMTASRCFEAAIDGDVKVCGEEDNPAYLIEVFDDEQGELTGTMVGHKEETLSRASFELNDIKVKTSMTEETEVEQEPEAEESNPDGEDESVENSEDFVTADELEDFKSEVIEGVKQELADGDDEEADEDDGDVESEASDEELSEFEEFRQENPDMSLSEAAEAFEEETKSAEEKIEEMAEKFESKIEDLESKLESKEEEVEELSEKVENPQRATQATDDGDSEDLAEKVSSLSDDELHAQVFKQLDDQGGVQATKEMMHNG